MARSQVFANHISGSWRAAQPMAAFSAALAAMDQAGLKIRNREAADSRYPMSTLQITAHDVSELLKRDPQKLLSLEAKSFQESFNRAPFVVGHNLAHDPLFSLPQLIELSRRLPGKSVKYNEGT